MAYWHPFAVSKDRDKDFMNNLPLIAIVGPPNAGKSTLLNKIAGRPLAVTSEVAGTTRDRQYVDIAWGGAEFTLVDTAGLEQAQDSELNQNVTKQIEVAMQQADALLLVLDGKLPARQLPQTTLKNFRSIKKPLLLVVNKLDSPKTREASLEDFKALGIKNIFGVSAISGLGTGDLLDAIASTISSSPLQNMDRGTPNFQNENLGNPLERGQGRGFTDDATSIGVSLIGKPNVGKSSIFNKILNQERAVVSSVPGTTRTAVDERVEINGINYTFIDTAGLKKKEFRQQQPDIFSGFQSFKAIRKSDVCLFVLDANEEITKQDQRVASEIFNMEKGCIILANKCDLLSKEKAAGTLGENTASIAKNLDDKYQSVRDYISHHFPFLWMCPLFFVSAQTGDGLSEAIAAIEPIYQRRQKQIDDETLKEFLKKVLEKNPPKLLRDQKKPKVFSLKQTATNPPMFELLVNHPAAISSQFRKFLENSIIKFLDFYGTPINLKLVGKDKA